MSKLIKIIQSQFCPEASTEDIEVAIAQLEFPDPTRLSLNEMEMVAIAAIEIQEKREAAFIVPLLKSEVSLLKGMVASLTEKYELLVGQYETIAAKVESLEAEVEVLSSQPQTSIAVNDLEPDEDEDDSFDGFFSSPSPQPEMSGEEKWRVTMAAMGDRDALAAGYPGGWG